VISLLRIYNNIEYNNL